MRPCLNDPGDRYCSKSDGSREEEDRDADKEDEEEYTWAEVD